MNGAQSLVQTLVNCGVDTCFANPGTSEMHLVAALEQRAGALPSLRVIEDEGLADRSAELGAWLLYELRKLRHDHIDIITRSVQPLLWLFIFGTVMRNNRSLTLGTLGVIVGIGLIGYWLGRDVRAQHATVPISAVIPPSPL